MPKTPRDRARPRSAAPELAPPPGAGASATVAPPFQRAGPDVASRRQAILLAAERLFAEHGYHGVSMRDIAAGAGVPVALVSYHYGGKQELYQAIFVSWQPSVQQRRALLQRALDDPAGTTLEAILQAFVGPLAAMNRDPAGRYFARMAARDLASPTPESEQAQHAFFDPMAHAFIDALQTLFPRATRADVAWCYQFMLGAVLHHLSDVRVERLSLGTATAADPAREPMLVAFVAAGFRGALGEPARPGRRTPGRKRHSLA